MKGSALLVIVVLVTFSAVGFVLMQAGAPSRFSKEQNEIKSSCPGDIGEELKFLADVALPFVDNVDEPQLQKRAESIRKNYQSAEQFYRINRCDEARFSAEAASNEYELLVAEITQQS